MNEMIKTAANLNKQVKFIVIQICTLYLIASCNTKPRITATSPNNQISKVNIDDSTIYSAITYLFNHKSSNPFFKYDRVLESSNMPFFFTFKSDSLQIVGLNLIFTTKDIEYMQTQKKQFISFKLDKSKLDNKIIISKDSIDLAKNKSFCYISFPVFNLHKNKFIVWTGYANGYFSSEQATYIYEKNGIDWKIIKVLNHAIT